MALATVIAIPEVDAMSPFTLMPVSLLAMLPLTCIAVPVDSDVVVTLSAYIPYSPPVMELVTFIAVPLSNVALTLPACMPNSPPVMALATFIPKPPVMESLTSIAVPEKTSAVILPAYILYLPPLMELVTFIPVPQMPVDVTLPAYIP